MPNRATKIAPPSLRTLKRHGLELIHRYTIVEESKTAILKNLAEVVVDIRSQFYDESGDVDWQGASYEYRKFMEALYDDAGIPPDSKSNLQAALRYHVGNALRERVTVSELERAGLLAASPKERMAAQRNEASALLRSLGTHDGTPDDVRNFWRQAIQAVDNVASKLAHLSPDHLHKREAVTVARELDETIAYLQAARRAVEKRLG
jgi:hypothetical protein